METLPRRPLRGARSVSIRRIEPTDAEPLRAFYAGLSPESRRRRFLGACSGLTPGDAERFAHGLGVVAVLRERGPRDGELIGHACLPLVELGLAEIAFAVGDEFQGQGIGRMLLEAAIAAAREAGVTRVVASMFVDNPAIHRLLLGTGLRHRKLSAGGGVDAIEIELGPGLKDPLERMPKDTSAHGRRPAQRGRSAHPAAGQPAIR